MILKIEEEPTCLSDAGEEDVSDGNVVCRSEEKEADEGHVHTVPGAGAGDSLPAESLPGHQHQRPVSLPPAPHRGPDTGAAYV